VRICLIGATHVSQNPRLLREADSLSEVGHDVRVIAPSFNPSLSDQDARHLKRRKWRYRAVDYRAIGMRGKVHSFYTRATRRVAQDLFRITQLRGLCEPGYTPALRSLIAAAACERSDWFIGHSHPALPVAAAAAKRCSAKLGFDCEDLLAANDPETTDMVLEIEKRYLGRCDYVSAPSACLARELAKSYEISEPIVLHNVFPQSLAQSLKRPTARPAHRKLRLHWFGKTIGPGRGLEDAVEAVGILGDGVELTFRGNWATGFEDQLQMLARKHSVDLVVHPPVDHDDLIKSLEDFDVGLALERPEHGNYSFALTNKIGCYALAGLAVAATDTPGHREFFDSYAAGVLYQAGDVRALARGLHRWVSDRESLIEAQEAAWKLAREKFCWDVEGKRFLKLFESSTVTENPVEIDSQILVDAL